MAKTVQFYFDFVSPYSYLAHQQLRQLCEKNGAQIEYVPLLLGALHKAQDVKSPAFIPAKSKWIYRDCHNWAEHYGMPLSWSKCFPFNSVFLLRVCIWLQQYSPERLTDFVHNTFDAIWQEQLNVNDEHAVAQHLSSNDLQPTQILQGTQEADIKQTLMKNGELAVEKELFGLPVFEVQGQVYFGQDRLLFVEKALNA